jgi:amino acid transporter
MARDKGMVFPSVFGRVHKSLEVPVEAILLTYAFNLCFGLLYLGPSVAFSAYTASCTILLNLSCALPVAILLIRGRGALIKHQTIDTPFKLGKYGYLCNIVSVVFVGVTTVFFCFPAMVPVDSNTMNYVSAVLGIFLVLLIAYWLIYGKRFEGPVSIVPFNLALRIYIATNVLLTLETQRFDVILGIAEQEREVRAASITVDGEKGKETSM